jgi:DNA-directed RNA polymerase specialized sigma24 family protein
MQMLVASGRTITGIAQETGLDWETVRAVLSRARESILRSTSDRLLAVRPLPDDVALIDATGTVRRVRALVAMGHSQQTLSDEVGCAFTYISSLAHGRRPTVTVALARAVREAYDKLAMSVGASVRARRKAERLGWHGPLAWDDDTIDDPRAVPVTDAVEPVASDGENLAARWLMGESVILGRAERDEVLTYLFEWTNDTTEEIAARLGMKPGTAERKWHRIKQRAECEGRRVWRRVYVPRERTMKQDEMGEAA